ncbi:hypothetical protein [Pseudoxanthomonas sp. PXM04]|uniref:hypothetical protein n=1 Tax=Pseudoxanthomonas sp. PXM04 TaxID=2769297 RepID=UPI00177C3ACE|nr:hypothetical protein [Pseudoxanthomonas sp. PXM04]MBD9377628.1 hypothetical protein [Pseudoxanthomonas sp. PXM04]
MGRGKRNLIDVLAGLPWPAGLVVGALGYLTLAHGVPMWFARQGGPLARAFSDTSDSLLSIFAHVPRNVRNRYAPNYLIEQLRLKKEDT